MNDLLALLHSSEANEWHTIANIATRLGCSRRVVEESLEHLRLNGEPIIAGKEGVRLSTDPAEIRAYAQGRRSRLASIARGTRSLLRTARRLDTSQPTLWQDVA